MQDCEAALLLDPSAMKAARRQAQALHDLGQQEAALTACRSFLATFPGHERDIEDLLQSIEQEVQRQQKVTPVVHFDDQTHAVMCRWKLQTVAIACCGIGLPTSAGPQTGFCPLHGSQHFASDTCAGDREAV